MVAAGYGVAYGLGEYLHRWERMVGKVKRVVLVGAILVRSRSWAGGRCGPPGIGGTPEARWGCTGNR